MSRDSIVDLDNGQFWAAKSLLHVNEIIVASVIKVLAAVMPTPCMFVNVKAVYEFWVHLYDHLKMGCKKMYRDSVINGLWTMDWTLDWT